MTPEVDLVVNTFKRSYRTVLEPGFFDSVADQNQFRFARRLVLVNNVDDVAEAVERAQAMTATGEIDGYRVVHEHLSQALKVTGLTRQDLGRIPHYSDCSLVAVTLPGPPFVVYWDADIRLEERHDWITPSLELMEHDSRVLVSNPRWTTDSTLEQVTMFTSGDFALGRGFSDQLYLVRRSDFSAPIYGERCTARLRYPLSAVAPIFEARVDAYMRHSGRLRATYLKARYLHPVQASGTATEGLSQVERLRHFRNRVVLKTLATSPWKKQCCRYM